MVSKERDWAALSGLWPFNPSPSVCTTLTEGNEFTPWHSIQALIQSLLDGQVNETEELPGDFLLLSSFAVKRTLLLLGMYQTDLTRKLTELPQINQLPIFFFVIRNAQKSSSYTLPSLNHVNIYLPHSYSSLIIWHEVRGLRALICLLFPKYSIQVELGLPAPGSGHLRPCYLIWWSQWPMPFLIPQGHPGGLLCDFIKSPGPTRTLLVHDEKGPTMVLKAQQ